MIEVLVIDEENPSELCFDQGGEVVVFDTTQSKELLSRKVVISNNTKLRWYGTTLIKTKFQRAFFINHKSFYHLQLIYLEINNGTGKFFQNFFVHVSGSKNGLYILHQRFFCSIIWDDDIGNFYFWQCYQS